MSALRTRSKGVWALVSLPVMVIGLSTLSGCGDGYPEDQKYPSRMDPIYNIKKKPDSDPPGLDSPGPQGMADLHAAWQESKGEPPLEPKNLPAGFRGDLEKLLEEYYGRPAKPTVKGAETVKNADNTSAAKLLLLDPDNLQKGSKLYRQQCLHCHGLTGDGKGPTGLWVNPHPRDYRQGVFKFISSKTGVGRKPAKADLVRVLRQGIDGSSMPSFGLLKEEELEQLASYVIHLSIRGEVEFAAMRDALSQKKVPSADAEFTSNDSDLDDEANSLTKFVAQKNKALLEYWVKSAETMKATKPFEDYLKQRADKKETVVDAIRRGYTYFQKDGRAGCASCHYDYGRQRRYLWEDWGTVTRAADLTAGIYRGGRRPMDFYYRIRGGIPSCGMSAQGEKKAATDSGLTEDEIWDVIEFVRALPYPAMLESAGIDDKIYPK